MTKQKKHLPDLTHQDPLGPIDLTSIGTNGDPCFGECFDLSTKECRACGDSELCALKMGQHLHKTRQQLEASNNYKDLDVLEDVDGIKKFLRKLKRQGLERREIVTKASEKFEVPSKIIRKLYKELKK